MVQVKVEKAKIDQKQTPLLVIGVFEGEQDFPHSKELDPSVSSSSPGNAGKQRVPWDIWLVDSSLYFGQGTNEKDNAALVLASGKNSRTKVRGSVRARQRGRLESWE